MGDYVRWYPAITGIRPSVVQFSSDSCTLFQKLMNIWGVQNTEKYGSIIRLFALGARLNLPLIQILIPLTFEVLQERNTGRNRTFKL